MFISLRLEKAGVLFKKTGRVGGGFKGALKGALRRALKGALETVYHKKSPPVPPVRQQILNSMKKKKATRRHWLQPGIALEVGFGGTTTSMCVVVCKMRERR